MLDKGNVVFGSWIVEETIGSGAFGTVYKIKREEYGNDVYAAMKVVEIPQDKEEHNRLRREGMDDESISQYYSQIAQNFIKEIEFLSSFDGITNIVEYQDHIIESNDNMGYTIYIKMQLLTPLARLLLNGDGSARFMDVGEVLRLGKDICSALEVCEKRNIIHRDIKIDNIFISEDGNYKLGDFGIAKQLEATQGEMSKKGTMLYMAPEVFRGENYDRTVDIYSLGIVLYRLLNKNRAPFFPNYPDPIRFSDKETANARRLRGDVFPDIIGVSEELNAIFKKACALNPRDRYQSAGELRAALESIAIAPVAPTAVVSVANISADDESTVGVFSGVPSANRSADDESTVGVFSGVPSANRSADDEATVGVFSGVPSANRSADDESTVGVFSTVPVVNSSSDDEATVGAFDAVPAVKSSSDDEATVGAFDAMPVAHVATAPVNENDIDDEKTESVFAPAVQSTLGNGEKKIKNESFSKEKDSKESKNKKMPIIAIIAVLVSIAIIITTVIVLNNKNGGTDNIEESDTAVLDEKYNVAVDLANAGKYTEAIAAFEALDGYKDSADKIKECNAAIIDTQYNDAIALMQSGKLDEAICLFSKLGDYKESKTYFSEILRSITVRETISAEYYTTVAVKSNGTVVAAGDLASGISDWTDIVSVCTSLNHVVGLKSDGTVVAAGWNDDGQCNVSGWADIVAISAGTYHTVGLKSDGTVISTYYNLSGWENIIAISASGYNVVGLKADGTVVSTLNDVSNWTDIVAISAGSDFTVGLKSDGTVVSVGENESGQCDVAGWTDIVAISAGEYQTVGLKSDGTVVVAGGDAHTGECNVLDWTDIVAVSAGFCHTIGLKSDGTILFVGSSWYYQTSGISSWRNIKIPNNN